MFSTTSRYHRIATGVFESVDGTEITYVRRRFLPPGDQMLVLAEVRVVDGDRLDLIAARTLGDPEQFWRICDAMNAMDPFDLTSEPGTRLRIPIPNRST